MLTKADIKLVKSLKERSVRLSEGIFVAEGDKLIGELIEANLVIRRLFTTLESTLRPTKTIDCEVISASEMERITHLRTAGASLALVEIPGAQESQSRKMGLTLVLDGVQDPGNIGTIIRLAHWFGIGQVYCSKDCADCYSPKVVQATMGAIASVEVIYTDLVPFLKAQKEAVVYGTFLEESENIYTVDLRREKNAIIVMGSEGRGISVAVEAVINKRLHIPSFAVSKGSESLNVGIATAIVVSEFRRGLR